MLKGIGSLNLFSSPSGENECVHSRSIEELIETSLEHFAIDDAVVLAEAYCNRVGSERSLLLLAHCLTRTQNLESAYHFLKLSNPQSMKMAKSRYMFALCAFAQDRLQEAESMLRDDKVVDKVELHPVFFGTNSLPYAHSLLANILRETNRVECAKSHFANSIRNCAMLWSSIRSYCELGGESVRDHMQPLVTLVSTENALRKSVSEERQAQQEDYVMSTPVAKAKAVEERRRAFTPERRRATRLRSTASDGRFFAARTLSTALRASENSPLTRLNKVNTEAALKQAIIAPLIESKQLEDGDEHELSNKRITRRAAAAAAAALSKETTNHEHWPDLIHHEFAGWFVQLAVVQECLSRFRSSEALAILQELNPFLAQLPLSLELRARIFFENGEYKRSCEVFEEIRRLYPRHLHGMEIYSTALWQLHDSKKLSALASKMAEIARNQPQTWCIAGNCFSVEKQHETAIECLERAIRLDHRFAYAYSLLGHELIDMNDFGRAAQAFRKAVQFSPNDYRAWYGLGLVHFKEEQLPMAKINLLRAVSINPNNNVLLCQLAVIEQALHNSDTAMQYLESALKHSPNNVPCRFHKARLLFDVGNYEAARVELEELRVLSPDEAHVFFLLGRVNRKLGNTHLALLNFSWATEIDPRGEQNNSALTQDKGPYDDEPI
ncbi:TPR [Globodera pallida]|nr:TPR [Globodera pallida]